MDPANIWHLLHLQGKKVAAVLLLIALPLTGYSQAFSENLPFSDDKWLHYGFSIGLHSSGFKLQYSDQFVTAGMDSVHSIMPKNSFGFSLGFITDFKISEFVNFRVLPKVTFYEYGVDFNYTDSTVNTQLVEATFIEVPLLIKFKSQRHRNFRAYVVGGISPGLEVSGKKRKELTDNKLLTRDFNLSAEIGIGMDLYFPLFKFSPEIRFSRGLLNLLREDEFGYSEGINALRTNVFTIYLQFSD